MRSNNYLSRINLNASCIVSFGIRCFHFLATQLPFQFHISVWFFTMQFKNLLLEMLSFFYI